MKMLDEFQAMKEADLQWYMTPDLDIQPGTINVVPAQLNNSPCHRNVDAGPSNVQVMASEQYYSEFAANPRVEEEIQITEDIVEDV